MKAVLELLHKIDDCYDEAEQIKVITEWHRLQIEKDREQIIKECALTLASENIIRKLPINLD